ncbi:unnamed protein product [Rotaria sp. Silwood2]|nr:unnamed protein product [Rotaria sp. Silwood2]CAF4630258.1 unnamed protein product [Rotaria sp. Silwood2]
MEKIKLDTKEQISTNNQQNSFLVRFGKRAFVYTSAVGVVGFIGIPTALSWVGFSSAGIKLGSLAAAWQSTHYLPGAFSLVQSAAATGAAKGVLTSVGVIGALKQAFNDAKKNPNETNIDNHQKIRSKL